MHPDASFRPADPDLAAALVRDVGFAMLFAATPDGPRVVHTPVLLNAAGTSIAFHLSRGNALARHIDGCTVLAVVNGPDAYVSPGWYAAADQVPTWNYVAVEMEGVARRRDTESAAAFLDALSAEHEARLAPAAPWTRDKMAPAAFDRLLRGIAVFDMAVMAWRPTFKLSQNKDAGERARVADGLDRAGRPAVAALVRRFGTGE